MTYRKGYFKALLDVTKLIERIEQATYCIKPSQRIPILKAVLIDVLNNHKLDYFMEQGGAIQFIFRIEKNKVLHMDVQDLTGVQGLTRAEYESKVEREKRTCATCKFAEGHPDYDYKKHCYDCDYYSKWEKRE